MKIKDIVAIMAVALAAGGCNQQDDGAQQDERLPILLKASVDVEAVGQTRAAGDWGERTTTMTQGSEFLAGEQVMAYIKEGDGTNPATIKWPIEYVVVNDGDGDADDGDLDPKTDTTPFYFPVGVNTINIHAIHPSYTSDAGFTVETDQTTEANYAKSDLCYSKPRDYTRSGTTAYLDANGRRVLQFKHLLSKIIVNLTVDATAATSAPSYISLHAKTTTAMTFPVDNANGYTGCTASDASYPGVIKMKQEAIIPPQDIAAGASFISMNVPGIGSMIYPMPTATSFESGKKYTYNLKVTDVGITATTNVTDWGTKTTEVVMANKIDYKLNPLWYVAESNLNEDGISFSTENSTSQGYCWRFNSSTGFLKPSLGIAYNTAGYNGWYAVGKLIDGESYHLPTQLEWASILPAVYSGNQSNPNTLWGSYPAVADVVTETPCVFGYNNDTKYGVGKTSNPTTPTGTAYQSYWSSYTVSSNVRYAIRFLGTDYCSVWKYQFVDYNTTTARLVISSRLIPPIQADDTDALSNKMAEITASDYEWSDDIAFGAVQRTFYACGYHLNQEGHAPGAYEGNMVRGTYACSTPYSGDYIYFFNFSNVWLLIQNTANKNYQAWPVRLFRDN